MQKRFTAFTHSLQFVLLLNKECGIYLHLYYLQMCIELSSDKPVHYFFAVIHAFLFLSVLEKGTSA